MARNMWRAPRRVAATLTAGALLGTLGLAACGSEGSTPADGETINVTVITKDPDNHFWTAMIEGARSAADELDVELTVAAGRDQTDADGQIQAIENAISRGDDAILIANNGPAVDDAITRARDAGLYVIALDTPTDPVDLVDATFASDNFEAGELIGAWTAGQLQGERAVIAMLDLFADRVVTVDYERDQGFLSGMGIEVNDPRVIGDEADSGSYSGGEYEIVCHQATNGAEDGGRTAMENCLSVNPDINVVFTANETSGVGAVQALRAAGVGDTLVTSIDGSCAGVDSVINGEFGAVAQQYPSQMGEQGVRAVVAYLRDGTEPANSSGRDFVNTGIALVTDRAVDGHNSIDGTEGRNLCW